MTSDSIETEAAADSGQATDDEAGEVTEVAAAQPADATADPFDAPVRADTDESDFVVRLDGFEGPLDVLLNLAQRQKVDLRQISVLALVEQYLAFIEEAKERDLELAADYLVMAAWLTFLKSRILLPAPKSDDDEPTADELSARLAFQLQRLDAMRRAADQLLELPQLHVDVFPRAENCLSVATHTEWNADLYDLMKAYTTQRVRTIEPTVMNNPPDVFQLEAARARLRAMLGDIPDWCLLTAIGADQPVDAPPRSVIASSFGAALEFARAGTIELRQSAPFAPIYVRGSRDGDPVQ